MLWFKILSLLFLGLQISCSSAPQARKCAQERSAECEVINHEELLTALGRAESQLSGGNSFQALRELESLRQRAYYHGKFRSLYALALNTSIQSTNKLSAIPNACTLVRERVAFLRMISSDRMEDFREAISRCGIDISKRIDAPLSARPIDLTQKEAADSNVYEEALKIQQKFNTNPWEDLLLMDLKYLSQFKLVLGKPVLYKDTPTGFIRFKVPLQIKHEGKHGYCSQYKSQLHDEELGRSLPCYDYVGAWENVTEFWRSGRQQWTENSYVMKINVSEASRAFIHDIPFIKNFKNVLNLDIQYGSGEIVTERLSVSYPGELVHNLMGRLAYMDLGGRPLRPHVQEVYIAATSREGTRIQIVKASSWKSSYTMDITLPLERARDLESLRLYVPVQQILTYFHELSRREIPVSGKMYGE